MKYFVFSILLPFTCFGQDLFLKIEKNKPRQRPAYWFWNADLNKYQKGFAYESYICGDELGFVCEDKVGLSQTFPLSALSNPVYANLKTIEQIEMEVANLSVPQTINWFKSFQNIYMVEILPNTSQIEVSKVTLFLSNK
jgi:hypothetical protein